MKYHHNEEGEWTGIKFMTGHKLACCDCGLVHKMDFRIINVNGEQKITFRARRDKRATAAKRRHIKKRLKQEGLSQNAL